MLSDVSERQGSKQGVAECVDGYVAVRVRDATCRAVYRYAAEPKRKPFGKGVNVISVSNSNVHKSSFKIISTNVNKKP